MFAELYGGFKSRRSRISPISELSLKGAAVHDAVHSLIHNDVYCRDFRNSEPAVQSGFQKLKIDGLPDNIIQALDPYPFYPACTYDHQGINNDMNDFNWIHTLLAGQHDDLYDARRWGDDFTARKEKANLMTPEEGLLLRQALQEAALLLPVQALEVLHKKCEPLFRKGAPDLFRDVEKDLKSTVANHMFKDITAGQDMTDHIAVSTVSSTAISLGTIEQLVRPGAKVILPIPYFDPFAPMLDMAGAKIITTDTTGTHFKLKADVLSRLIKDNKMGPNDWLFLTSPNNATIASYTRKELQDIADVIAQSDIRVICDELYARLDKEPHVSLASLKSGRDPNNVVRMRDRVITVTGFSKQFPFGSDLKLGGGLFPDPDEAYAVQDRIKKGGLGVDPGQAVLFKRYIDSTPQQVRDDACKPLEQEVKRVQNLVNRVNIRFSNLHDGLRPFELVTSDNGYLACLKLAPELCQKFGIRTSDDLMSYMFATTGIATKSMMAEGVEKPPMVRVNVSTIARALDDVETRLDKMAELADARRPTTMREVNKAMNSMIRHHIPGITREQVSYASR
jgi:aspartate/methionine/tyrosine aminotransferase